MVKDKAEVKTDPSVPDPPVPKTSLDEVQEALGKRARANADAKFAKMAADLDEKRKSDPNAKAGE